MDQRHTPKTLPGFPIARDKWPIFGHMNAILKGGREKLLEYTKELGPAFWLHMGFGNWAIHISGPMAYEVMKNKKTRSVMSDPRFAHTLDHSMLVKDGNAHRKARASMNAPFTPRGLTATGVGEIIDEILRTELETWSEGMSLPLLDVTSRMALDVIFRILGVPAEDLPEWRKHYDHFFTPGAMIPVDLPGTPLRRSKQARRWLDQQFSRLLEKARAEGEQETMLGALAHAKDEQGQSMSETELLANLRLLGFAGHETTAAIMGWMMLHAAQDPNIWDGLCEEANAMEGLPTSPKQLQHVPFAEALFRECLRLYPPVMLVSREVVEPLEVEHYVIPERTIVTASVVCLSMDPETYPEPMVMKPERWLGRERAPSPTEAVQFGGGPHFCLGYHMAVLEGTFFMVYAARMLSEKGLRPSLAANFPAPVYLPLTHPPQKIRVLFLAQ
ncbi:MAG: cytochrome P450 [Myxococcota bacterium]